MSLFKKRECGLSFWHSHSAVFRLRLQQTQLGTTEDVTRGEYHYQQL